MIIISTAKNKLDAVVNIKFNTRCRFSPIGLDIGSSLIKLIQLKSKRGQLTVHCQAAALTPPGTFRKGRIYETRPLIKLLRQICNQYPWYQNNAVLSFNYPAYYWRLIQLPPLKKTAQAKAMRWAVEKYFPLNFQDAVYDFHAVNPLPAEQNGSQTYLLIAASRTDCNRYTDTVYRAGFYPAALEIVPVALLRSQYCSYAVHPEITNALCMLLDIGTYSSSLLITRNGIYQFLRILKIGTAHFCHSVNHSFSTQIQHTNRIVFGSGSLAERGIRSTAQQLVDYAAQSLAYWHDRAGSDPDQPVRIKLCGGGALIPGLLDSFRQQLNCSSIPDKSFTDTNKPHPVSHATKNRLEPLFATAYGLAVRNWIR